MDIDSDAKTSHSDLTKEEWSQVYIEEAKEMADGEQQEDTSSSADSTVGYANALVQHRRFLAKYLKELLESDRKTFSDPLFLDRVDDFLQDHDTSVLSTALILYYDLKEYDDNESACLQRIGTYLVGIFLQAQDERIRNQAFKNLIAVISTRNMIESMITTYGAGLSEATGIKLLETTAASLVKSKLTNGLKDFNTMMLFITRTSNHIPDFYRAHNTEFEPPKPIFSKIVVEAHLLAECFICTFQTSRHQQRHQLVPTVLQRMPNLVRRCVASLSAISAFMRIVRTIDIAEYEANSGFRQLFPALATSMTNVYNNGVHGDPSQALRIYGAYAAYLVQPRGNEHNFINFVIQLRRYIDVFCRSRGGDSRHNTLGPSQSSKPSQGEEEVFRESQEDEPGETEDAGRLDPTTIISNHLKRNLARLKDTVCASVTDSDAQKAIIKDIETVIYEMVWIASEAWRSASVAVFMFITKTMRANRGSTENSNKKRRKRLEISATKLALENIKVLVERVKAFSPTWAFHAGRQVITSVNKSGVSSKYGSVTAFCLLNAQLPSDKRMKILPQTQFTDRFITITETELLLALKHYKQVSQHTVKYLNLDKFRGDHSPCIAHPGDLYHRLFVSDSVGYSRSVSLLHPDISYQS
ncbi:hypothetical protein BGX24_008200 [Mortierella sp. AD032]|nr:hypothetical protein BGX24_008200 [Mortierella sp. AD032]